MTGSACDQARGAPYHFQFSRDAKEEECYEAMSICATGEMQAIQTYGRQHRMLVQYKMKLEK